MRIVSLLPSATEILGALDLTDQLLAVSHECDTPASVTALPRITASIIPHGLPQAEVDRLVSAAVRNSEPLYTVNAELLAQIRPDLIVTQGVCDVCAVTPEVVNHALDRVPAGLLDGVRVLSLDARSIEGVFQDVIAVAEAAGVPERGQALVASHRARWQALGGGPRKKILLLEWAEPPYYGGHWVPEQIAAAGGEDILGKPGVDSGRTTWARVHEGDPDVLVVACCGYNLDQNLGVARRLLQSPDVQGLRAVREGRIWAADANAYYSRPALRLVRGAEVLAHVLRDGPDLPGEAVRVTPPA